MYHCGDQSGKVCVITGSNSGLGKEAARRLVAARATVIMAVRAVDKGERVKKKILTEYPHGDITVVPLDLADLAAVKTCASQLRDQLSHIDVLINNAGVMTPPSRHETKDGFELQFGTNYLGHVALTSGLWPLLQKGSTQGTPARVVTMSSVAALWGNIDFNDLQWQSRKYSPIYSYAQSKLADALLTLQLADFADRNNDSIISTAAHPGWTKTSLWNKGAGLDEGNSTIRVMNKLAIPFCQNVQHGVKPMLYAALASDVMPRQYYGPKFLIKGSAHVARFPGRVHNDALCSRLWHTALELTHNPATFIVA